MKDSQQIERWISAYWSEEVAQTFDATLDISAYSRNGLLADITACLSELKRSIRSINAREVKDDDITQILITIGVADLEQLKQVMAAIKRISSVISVERSAQI